MTLIDAYGDGAGAYTIFQFGPETESTVDNTNQYKYIPVGSWKRE